MARQGASALNGWRLRDAVRFTNLALLHEVAGRGPGLRRHIPAAFFLLGLTALLVSLARPSMVLAVPRDQASVMLVLDVSGSMAARDIQPTPLGAEVHSLDDGRPVLYAADAAQLEQIYGHFGSQIQWVQEQTEVTFLANAIGALLQTIGGGLALFWFGRLP